MTKAIVIGLAALVWSAGFAATGALVHVLERPLPQPLTANIAAPAPVARAAETSEPEARHVVLPMVEIVTKIPRATPKKEPPHEMKCSDWRPLEQGSNSVQICE